MKKHLRSLQNEPFFNNKETSPKLTELKEIFKELKLAASQIANLFTYPATRWTIHRFYEHAILSVASLNCYS